MTSVFSMNNILENNEDLHEEFKTLLVKIEPHFVALKSNLEKLLCREWLHKLFKTGKHEESLRNAYLTKLIEQLKKGELKEPFNNLPKHKSPLPPLHIHNLSKQNINVRDRKPVKKVEETLFTDVVDAHTTVYAPKSTENHVHTKEIKTFVDVCDNITIKAEEETLITNVVNVHEIVDAPKSMENHVHAKETNMPIDVREDKTIKTEEETLITDVVNVHETVVPKSTENHVHTKEVKIFGDVRHVCDNIKTIKTVEETLITDVVNVHETVVPKPTENHEHTNEIKVNASSNQIKELDINEIVDDSKKIQWQSTIDKSEGGDGLTLNVETKLKLESIEKLSDELKKKTEFLAEQVREIKLYTDENLINGNQIIALNAELNKFKNDMENMRDQEAADELGASKLLKHILDKTTVLDNKIVSEMQRLKTMVEDACASKKSNNFAIEQLKEVHRLKMDEKDKLHAMLNRKLMIEVSQLKEYAIKVEEDAKYKHLSTENYYKDAEDDYSST